MKKFYSTFKRSTFREAYSGTAMMAWSRMQFDDVSDEEREATFKAMLKYCELDILAMVMIHQHWQYLRKH